MILQVDAKNGEGDKGAYSRKHEPFCSNEEQVKGKTKGTSFSKEVMYLNAILTFTKGFVILIKLKKKDIDCCREINTTSQIWFCLSLINTWLESSNLCIT